jgi:hypothetical protein
MWVAEITRDQAKDYAAIAGAGIAILAAFIATTAILVQRSIARKRAAIDFFLKAELDNTMRAAYDDYETGIKALKAGVHLNTFRTSKEYDDICAWLDAMELFAVGIETGIFDRRTCYHFWGGEVIDVCNDAISVINDVREQIDDPAAYKQLTTLNELWASPPRRWQRWRDEFTPLTTLAKQLPSRVRCALAKRRSRAQHRSKRFR